MTTYASTASGSDRPGINACQAGDVRVVPFEFTVNTALALNDVVKLAKLPARHVPVDCFIDCPDLDTGGAPAVVLDAGFWEDDDTPTVVDVNAMVAASTVGQAGGLLTPNVGTYLALAPVLTDRVFGLLVNTAPATGATGVTLRGWFSYRPASYDD